MEHEQSFDHGIGEVFSFFADAQNLPLLIPGWISFGMVDPGAVEMAQGTHIDYTVRLHGIPFAWQSEISAWEPPYRFVDEQRKGPFRWWIHAHTFEEVAPQQTVVRDVVRYGVPGGAPVQKLIVEPDLRRIFAHRRRQLEEIFRGAAPRAPALRAQTSALRTQTSALRTQR
ncbi:MAG: SRPBCC family protein [Deltaproteobacteria bacterium]|nr:SRPBCC family protein [Deltaproteobacteria bacterium]MBW2414906.1 SRPBCC family protein [Deltaproteobacteria bacterium]